MKTKLRRSKELKKWALRDYKAPSPHFIKQAVVKRNAIPGGTFVESGTYYGQTTDFAAQFSSRVISLEPAPELFSRAVKLFSNRPNIEVLNGTSEQIFPELLPTLKGEVTFWLDGHYSAGPTYQGPNDTPVRQELDEISKNIGNFTKLSVMVDDIRCFENNSGEYAQYPPLTYLTEWAESHKMKWHIEHDIICMRNF